MTGRSGLEHPTSHQRVETLSREGSAVLQHSVCIFSISCAQLTRNLCDMQLWTIETISQYHQLLVYTLRHFHPEQVRLIPGPTFKVILCPPLTCISFKNTPRSSLSHPSLTSQPSKISTNLLSYTTVPWSRTIFGSSLVL